MKIFTKMAKNHMCQDISSGHLHPTAREEEKINKAGGEIKPNKVVLFGRTRSMDLIQKL